MKREELKKLGIEDGDMIDKIMKLHGQSVEELKTNFEKAGSETQSLKSQLEEAHSAIEGFKKLDIEGVKQAADEWKQKAEKIKEESEKQVKQLKFDHALEKKLSEARAKNVRAVKALLDTNKVTLNEEGNLEGLDEQLETVKTENDYLFEPAEPEPKIVARGKSKTVVSDSMIEAARKGANLDR